MNTAIGDTRTISDTKIPKEIIWSVLAICVIPFFLNLIGIDFGTLGQAFDLSAATQWDKTELVDAMHHTLAGSFVHTILEWSAFCAAILIVLVSFLNYSIKGNPMTPILGVALFFSGLMDAFHTLAADRLIEAVADNQNLIPFTWAICRLFNALIMIVGVSILLIQNQFTGQNNRKKRLNFVIIVSAVFGFIAYGIIHFCATSNNLPNTMFPDSMVTRPWDVTPLVLFSFAGLFLYPRFYQKSPNLFSHAVVISAIPNVATQLYMAFGSVALFDNNFNIAHFLKIIAYLVPLIGLSLEYIHTYQSQTRSLSKDLRQSLGFLNSLVKQVLESTTLTTQIAASGNQLETMMTEQVSSTNNVVATTQQISQISEKLVNTMNEMQEAFGQLEEASDSLSNKLGAIAEKAVYIDNIVTTITEIAHQTKVLSLNASIQATEAGEQGKGFAVVAQEIVQLSSKTAVATTKIQQIVKEMHSAVSTGVREMNHFTNEHVEALTPRIQMVNQGIKAQLEGAHTISSAIVQLSQSSTQTANYLRHTLQDTNSALEQLNEAVQKLQREVSELEVNS
ncbi:MAG: methyl-accepting chemotaxis protein [Coleofasciculus sp. S288]|nr:methyl-accepting chemotaxis protein [Coleofasciculus sp. S288]